MWSTFWDSDQSCGRNCRGSRSSKVEVKILYHSVWEFIAHFQQSLRISPILFSTSLQSPESSQVSLSSTNSRGYFSPQCYSMLFPSHRTLFPSQRTVLNTYFYAPRLGHLTSPAASFPVFSLCLTSPLWRWWHLNACIHLYLCHPAHSRYWWDEWIFVNWIVGVSFLQLCKNSVGILNLFKSTLKFYTNCEQNTRNHLISTLT